MVSSKGAKCSLEQLKSITQNTKSLLSQLEAVLHAIAVDKTVATTPPPPSSNPPQSVDALALAHDSASLIKAHTTRVSLLIINEPFTPSAIIKVLNELVAGPIPGIASAVQACEAEKYTSVARQDLAWRCYRVLKELRCLVDAIPLDGKVLSVVKKNGANGDVGSITATGVIWAACDDVILLKSLGIGGLLVKKVEQYRDTLKDVLEELKEWKEEGENEEADENDQVEYVTNHLETTHISTQDMLDDFMSTQHIPRDDPEKIRERLDSCMKRLRLTTLLCSAIIKRRLKTLPPVPTNTPASVTKRLDEVFPVLKRMVEGFNEVACAFYEMEPDAIDRTMDACFFDAFAASEMMMSPWEGQKDEFAEWAEKFQVGIKKPD
ncbi:uncharacterized protein BCR38DRAFT_348396 [Pseudomassariella vexata]|uniref:Cyclin-D1-binding protein 1-like N-terminal domain-containing protein n=1 Tax=Pseudomassariella vexata TaxID=1141098 RepID=A0A1Y2DQB5_9PEZI|nr:uncharacterized protein BCR38DRAFT_348396 [Pseudomassariella vexata]ORY61482.1 hypothetical protein BCR38DRAFT_348396 [Pseudomassariella vexata]